MGGGYNTVFGANFRETCYSVPGLPVIRHFVSSTANGMTTRSSFQKDTEGWLHLLA